MKSSPNKTGQLEAEKERLQEKPEKQPEKEWDWTWTTERMPGRSIKVLKKKSTAQEET